MATTICPYCNIEVSEKEIEAEDGCCPECGSMLSASSMYMDGDMDDYDPYEDSDFDDEDDGIISGNWFGKGSEIIAETPAGDGYILSDESASDFNCSVSFSLEAVASAFIFRANEDMSDYIIFNYDNNEHIVKMWSPRGELGRASAPNVNTNNCDLLIAVGMRFSDRVTGKLSTYAKQAKVVHIDIDHAEINKNVQVDVPIVGDCKEVLAKLTALVQPKKHTEWVESFAAYNAIEYDRVIDKALHPTEGPLLMGEVARKVSEATANSAILVTDVGQNQMMSSRYFKFTQPHSILTSGGLGTMGYGLPAAIGAKIAMPHRTVCLFTGDGGFQMNIQELGTIMEQGVGVKMILLNNNYLGNVRQWQELFFNHRYSWTPMLNPEYSLIAQGYGIPSRLVIERSELDAAIEEMLSVPGPFLLHVAVKEEDNVMPMTAPGATISDMIFE